MKTVITVEYHLSREIHLNLERQFDGVLPLKEGDAIELTGDADGDPIEGAVHGGPRLLAASGTLMYWLDDLGVHFDDSGKRRYVGKAAEVTRLIEHGWRVRFVGRSPDHEKPEGGK